MPRYLHWSWLLTIPLAAACGCADNSMVLKGKVTQFEQQQATLTRQNQELVARAAKLDQDNQELGKTVAQWQQQSKVFEDQVAAMRDQLRAVNVQLAQAKSEKEDTDKKVQTLNASMQRQGGVSITPNNSFLSTLPAVNLPEVFVRRDGDVIRVELPGDRLFETGSNRLKPGASETIAAAAAEVLRTYPDQMIAVEGHTDNDPAPGGQFRGNRELSFARAMSVYDVLASRARIPDDQLIVVGHGANRPVMSNASLEGKRRNRRVELVVYPDRRPGK
ncbi:MAG: OmpA family protein [Pirellulales bacterium]|nr:OmpA family protein [Pirellulales bacterium]